MLFKEFNYSLQSFIQMKSFKMKQIKLLVYECINTIKMFQCVINWSKYCVWLSQIVMRYINKTTRHLNICDSTTIL